MTSTPAPGPAAGGAPELLCSARGCRASAQWALRWNNPKLHTADRRKTWLACDDHRQSLGEHLAVRGFLRETVPVGDLEPEQPGPVSGQVPPPT